MADSLRGFLRFTTGASACCPGGKQRPANSVFYADFASTVLSLKKRSKCKGTVAQDRNGDLFKGFALHLRPLLCSEFAVFAVCDWSTSESQEGTLF